MPRDASLQSLRKKLSKVAGNGKLESLAKERAVGSAVEQFNGFAVRVSMSSSTVALADSVVYDVLVGCQVAQAKGGVVLCG
jgi:hypothetical protein